VRLLLIAAVEVELAHTVAPDDLHDSGVAVCRREQGHPPGLFLERHRTPAHETHCDARDIGVYRLVVVAVAVQMRLAAVPVDRPVADLLDPRAELAHDVQLEAFVPRPDETRDGQRSGAGKYIPPGTWVHAARKIVDVPVSDDPCPPTHPVHGTAVLDHRGQADVLASPHDDKLGLFVAREVLAVQPVGAEARQPDGGLLRGEGNHGLRSR
jgi:hypothetical protein